VPNARNQYGTTVLNGPACTWSAQADLGGPVFRTLIPTSPTQISTEFFNNIVADGCLIACSRTSHNPKLSCLVLSVSAVWKLETRQDSFVLSWPSF